MGIITDTLRVAQERAKQLNLTYEGALTPREAYDILQHAPGAKIVDVRTRAELEWVGRIPGAVEIEWMLYPGNQLNPNFLVQLRHQVDPEALVMFICRSGARSHNATMLASDAGYTECYNILEGFEGDKNVSHQRGKLGGWRHAGLPWTQS